LCYRMAGHDSAGLAEVRADQHRRARWPALLSQTFVVSEKEDEVLNTDGMSSSSSFSYLSSICLTTGFRNSIFRLNIENLRYSIQLKMTERSDIHKYSICNLQFSIPTCSEGASRDRKPGSVRSEKTTQTKWR
jgi:hypothetical protein